MSVELLRDDANYYGKVGRAYLSNSDVGTLLSDPQKFKQPIPDNINFAKGRYFHQLILEPTKAEGVQGVDAGARTTNIYKDAIAERGVDFAMLTKEMKEIEHCVAVMMGNLDFYDLIRGEGNVYEEPAIGEFKGVKWKGKADIVTPTMVLDLKTTSNLADFKYSARKYNYDSQCYIYQTLFGKPLIFLAIEKQSGALGIFRPSEDFVRRGEDKVERAMEVYSRFFGDTPSHSLTNYYVDEVL